MRLVLTILLALSAALALGIFLEDNPGRLVFSYGDVMVQTSFVFFVIVMIIVFIALYYFFSLTGKLLRLPRDLERWTKHRRTRRSEKYLTQGFLGLVEGNWQAAEQAFRKGAAYSCLPMVNYLGAARAAQQQGAITQRDHYLRLAHEFSGGSTVAVGLTQAELQLSQQQTEQAYATLKHLDTDKSGQAQAKLMLLEASSELKEWQQVLDLLRGFGRGKLLPKEKIKSRQLQAYAGLLQQAGKTEHQYKLEAQWHKIPSKLKNELYLIEVYIRQRLRFPDTGDCERLLRQTLKRKWDSVMAGLYGLVVGSDQARQLAFAERMHKAHAADTMLLLTLGRLCKRQSLWGKASTYLQECIDIQASPEAYQELAALLEQQGDHAAAAECYQKGLSLVTKPYEQVNLIKATRVEDAARKVV